METRVPVGFCVVESGGADIDCHVLASNPLFGAGARSPTLVISGDHEFIPAATAAHITQAMPNARLVMLKDCGHFSYLERPAAVREEIDAFFRGERKPAPLQ